jgi:hypothetical protein
MQVLFTSERMKLVFVFMLFIVLHYCKSYISGTETSCTDRQQHFVGVNGIVCVCMYVRVLGERIL